MAGDVDADAALSALRAPLAGTAQVHLNNAGVSPLSAAAERAGVEVLAGLREGSLGLGALLQRYERARATFAKLCGVDKSDLAFFQTCAAALSQAAFGIALQPGDEIVTLDQEYPSNRYPWLRAAERASARVVVVESAPDFSIDLDRVVAAITKKTRVVAVSWVQFQAGAVLDLAALSAALKKKSPDAWLVVDAIQGLGVLPFDLTALGVDIACGGTHKWLLGPVGHGFMALAPGRRAQLTPLLHGAITYGTPDDPVDERKPPRDGPQRFEPGTPMLQGAIAAAASVEVLLSIGIERVHAEACARADEVIAAARRRGYALRTVGTGALRSPIVTFTPRGNPGALLAQLTARGVSVGHRAGGLRVAPHAHNGPQHVERLFAELDALEA